MKHKYGLFALFLLAAGGTYATVVGDVRVALNAGDFRKAEAIVQQYQKEQGITPEYLEAESWLGRGALAAKQYDKALQYAAQTRDRALALLKKRPLDAETHLPIALGATIEVTAQTMAAQGQRDQAVLLLRREIATYRNTSIRARLQKNLNLLTLEGKPAPALEIKEYLGPKPVPLASLKGKPVLLFFWAHWCPDCKSEAALLAQMQKEYASQGLTIIGPTQHYGYVANGQETTPAAEVRYIDQVRKQFYAPLANMPVPVSDETFRNYGASTTPTLVFIDRQGIVQAYHPGAMNEAELKAAIGKTLAPHRL